MLLNIVSTANIQTKLKMEIKVLTNQLKRRLAI